MDTQETIKKYAGTFNPRVIGAGDTVEFTYPFTSAAGIDRPVENTREFNTIGGAKKKQAETDKYRVTLVWFEPNNNVPERLYDMRDNSGDRTVTVTFIHAKSIIGRADYDASSGGSLTCYIADFTARRAGTNGSGEDMYWCTLTLQEE